MALGALAVILTGAGVDRWGEAAGDLGRVVIGKANDTIGFSVADVAQHEGYFDRRGVHAELVVLGNSTVANSALTAGSVQFSMTSAPTLLLGRAKSLPLIAVAQTVYGSPLQLVAGRNLIASAQVTRQTPLRQRLEALQNAVLAVTGPTDQGAYALAFQAVGVTPQVASSSSATRRPPPPRWRTARPMPSSPARRPCSSLWRRAWGRSC